MEARPPISRRSAPKFWVALQPSIVRIYKVAGLVALTAILIGLIGFLTVNIFYFFDKSWTRPIVLDKTHEKVIAAGNQLAEAKERVNTLHTEKLEIESQLTEIDRTVAVDEKFIAEAGTQEARDLKTPDAWLLRREIDKAKLDKEHAISRRIPLTKRLESVKARIAEQDKFVTRLKESPYARALEHKLVMAFASHKNLRENVSVGTKLYGCKWGLVRCSHVGKVTAIIEGEVTDKHPHDESTQRGQLVEIEIEPSAIEHSVLFAGGKPLWLF
jgi:hypothetical protein